MFAGLSNFFPLDNGAHSCASFVMPSHVSEIVKKIIVNPLMTIIYSLIKLIFCWLDYFIRLFLKDQFVFTSV